MNDSVTEDVPLSEYNTTELIGGFIWIAVTTAIVISFPIFYKKVRCKFPITVNCWFCNKNAKVPYEDANSWDCPHCEQYNGFTQDGGYNKIIKEQHLPGSSLQQFTTPVNQINKKGFNPERITSNGLCKLCNINQQLKIQQLAKFMPLDDKKYDEEVEKFRQHLENAYRLCSLCEKTLKDTLHKQQCNLLRDRLNVQNVKNLLNSVHSRNYFHITVLSLRRAFYIGLKLISGIISVVIFLSFVNQLETEQNFIKTTLPEISLLDYKFILQEFLYYLTLSYSMRKEVISIGLLCHALSSFCRQVSHDEPFLLIFWGILYTLSWSELTELQVFVSVICLGLNALDNRKMRNYTLKKLARNESEENSVPADRSEKIVEPPRMVTTPPDEKQLPKMTMPIPMPVPKPKESEEAPTNFRVVQPVPEVAKKESPIAQTSPNSTVNSQTPRAMQTPQLRSRKVFNKNFLAQLQSEKVEKEISPPPDVFRNLANLHISTECPSPGKASNFLFENHNFEERCKRPPSIIKSPKFVKPTSLWGNLGDLNESVSRSSTPSSGYSSQKPDKPEVRPSSFHCPKVLSPVPLGGGTPAENYDYWERGNGIPQCLSPMNYHYFPPGYVPFQQFPNPLGHTTMYTYTRPGHYPFPFPPSPSPQSYRFSPTSPTRLSDVSDSENLFQNASNSLRTSQKWSTIKTILYNVSIFLNVVSTCVLVYFTWSGIISLTGN